MEGRARERWRRQEEGRIPVPRAPQKSRHSQGSPPVFINWRGRGPGGRPLAGRTVRGKRAYARERAPRGAARLPRLAQRAPVRQRPLAPAFAPTALPSSPLSKQLTLLPVKGRQSQDAGTDVEGAAGRGRCGGAAPPPFPAAAPLRPLGPAPPEDRGAATTMRGGAARVVVVRVCGGGRERESDACERCPLKERTSSVEGRLNLFHFCGRPPLTHNPRIPFFLHFTAAPCTPR